MASTPNDIWEKQPNEPTRSFLRFEQFRLLGPARTIEDVYQAERKETGQKSKRPTSAWYKNSKKWRWVERAEAWDLHISQAARAEEAERRIKILRSGYALHHERVDTLNKLIERLLGELKSDLWLNEAKGIGSGDDFEKIETKRFNASLVSELRAAMADIAAETGGRVKRTDMTTDGKPLTDSIWQFNLDALDDDEFETFTRIFTKITSQPNERAGDGDHPSGSSESEE